MNLLAMIGIVKDIDKENKNITIEVERQVGKDEFVYETMKVKCDCLIPPDIKENTLIGIKGYLNKNYEVIIERIQRFE